MATIPEVCLSPGSRSMPLNGMGTAAYPFPDRETIKAAVLHAIELGYHHFDTAAQYYLEQFLGEAIAEALRLGLSSSDGVHRSLSHSFSGKPEAWAPVQFDKDILALDIKSTWKAMEECHKLGLAKLIGVSNFSCKMLSGLLATATIPPAVNQVEMHPLWQQQKLREFCAEKGVHVSAYSPLGGKGNMWGTNLVMDCEVLKEIAEARGKTVAQICLRWVHEQGVSMLVKSFNKERLKQNLQIFDWELTEEESHKISLIPQIKSLLAQYFVSEKGPYKSIQEFWDGEV